MKNRMKAPGAPCSLAKLRIMAATLAVVTAACGEAPSTDRAAAPITVAGELPPQRARPLADCTRWEPTVVELRGRLIVSLRYGPPNYGETPEQDEKRNTPFLELGRPITLCPEPDPATGTPDADSGTTATAQVQMNFAYVKPWPRELHGREVVARGTLYPSFTGYHYTPAVMMVEEIRAAGDDGGHDGESDRVPTGSEPR